MCSDMSALSVVKHRMITLVAGTAESDGGLVLSNKPVVLLQAFEAMIRCSGLVARKICKHLSQGSIRADHRQDVMQTHLHLLRR